MSVSVRPYVRGVGTDHHRKGTIMGTETFFLDSPEVDPQTAFKSCRDHGTIAEKSGFTIIQPQPVTLDEAQALADRLIAANDPRIFDKWGPAGAIPLCDETPAEVEYLGRVEVEVDFEGVPSNDELAAAVEAQVQEEHGADKTVASYFKTAADHTYQHTVTKPETATETRYFVVRKPASQMPQWDTGYPTQDEAVAHLADEVEQNPHLYGMEGVAAEVISLTRCVDGAALATYERTVTTVTYKVTVLLSRIVKPAHITPGVAGWMFFGWMST